MKFFFAFILLSFTVFAFSQNDVDALRYSRLGFGGTARFNSMAGSMGALGGDISTMSFNPAGIGVFRKSEISISPSLALNTTNSVYNGEENFDGKLNLNIGNIGLIAAIKLKDDNKSGWEMLHFGFGYNRTNNFQNKALTQGFNTSSSLLDAYVNDANISGRNNWDAFSTELAYQTYLINPKPGDTAHYSQVIKNYGQLQRNSITTKGSMGETFFTFGGNYKNKLYLGATLGIVNVKYIETADYEEIDTKDTISNFKSYTLNKNLTSKGTGINLKLGAIYRATDWLRLGIAVHTPTSISMTDSYSSSIKSNFDNGTKYSQTSPLGSFNYTVTTPFRAIGSVAVIINKLALLNVDYEYVNYPAARLSSQPNVFSDVNQTIKTKYTSSTNLRVGGELRFDPIAIRLGYALYGSPFKNGENVNATRSSYTGGLGYRNNDFFMDLAVVVNSAIEYNYLYDPTIVNSAKNTIRSTALVFTIGAKF